MKCGVSLDDATLSTFPVAHNGIVDVSLSRPLIIEVSVPNGKALNYRINWGDGSNSSLENRSMNTNIPHFYYQLGNYSVSMTVSSAKDTLHLGPVHVQVSRCGSPLLAFSYGSKDHPEVYTKSMSKKIVGTWVFNNTECKKAISPLFTFGHWKIKNEGNVLFFSNTTQASLFADQVVEYHINKGDLDEGMYEIELAMVYKGSEEKYTGYVQMKKSELVPVLLNGIHATVPYKIMKQDGNASTHNFSMDASRSLDPDDPKAKWEDMKFEWFCRILSSTAEIQDATLTALKDPIRNPLVDFNTCNNQEWTAIGDSKPTLVFNTGMFLQGMEYEFSVIVHKDLRQASATQRLKLSEDVTPPIILE